ncbi:ribonuclease H-like domain-containing protein [Tanacetum coccineum]
MAGSDDENPPPPPPPPQTPTQQAPHTVSTIKLPILKKDTNGVIKVLPPKTAEEILARERERKARTTLLMALPEDHLAKFHKMTDAKEMWDAIKSRFGGNDESKKMQLDLPGLLEGAHRGFGLGHEFLQDTSIVGIVQFLARPVTGASQQVVAMELVDKLEVTRRGPYSGGFGGIAFTGDMEIALALRTIVFPTASRYDTIECENKAAAALAPAIDLAESSFVIKIIKGSKVKYELNIKPGLINVNEDDSCVVEVKQGQFDLKHFPPWKLATARFTLRFRKQKVQDSREMIEVVDMSFSLLKLQKKSQENQMVGRKITTNKMANSMRYSYLRGPGNELLRRALCLGGVKHRLHLAYCLHKLYVCGSLTYKDSKNDAVVEAGRSDGGNQIRARSRKRTPMKTMGHGSERMQWLSGFEASQIPVIIIGIEHISAMKFIVAIMLLLTAMRDFHTVGEYEKMQGSIGYGYGYKEHIL